MNIEKIKEKLKINFPEDKIEVFDSRGTGDHYSIIVISDDFQNISLVDRHRMIYSIFEKEIITEIHAMQIQTYTRNEWKNKKNISN
tara:strand:- start:297 stop:554 length:258 start_codon:yes stop_codon:yes gene_type:complete